MTEAEQEVLCAVPPIGGLSTRDIAAAVPPRLGHDNRMHSAAVRNTLTELEQRGVVRRLGDQTPVCWQRIETGPHENHPSSASVRA